MMEGSSDSRLFSKPFENTWASWHWKWERGELIEGFHNSKPKKNVKYFGCASAESLV